MPGVEQSIEIKAPISQIFGVISDFENYPNFFSNIQDVSVQKKTKNKVQAAFTLHVIMDIHYTLDLVLYPPDRISWSLVKGDMMKSNNGSWTLKEMGKNKTLVTYAIDINFGMLVPKKVVNMLIHSGLPEMLQALKENAESKK